MKKTIIGILAFSLIFCFAGCASKNEPTTTEPQTKQTTTKIVTTAPTSEQTTTEKTTKKEADISFIYNGYWYRTETNRVVAIKFIKGDKATISYFKNKDLKGGSIAEETTYSGAYYIKDGLLKLVNTDLAVSEDEYEVFRVKNGALTYLREDPEGSSEIEMINNSSLSAKFARTLVDDAG